MLHRRHLLGAPALLAATTARAQGEFPTRPVRIVLPFGSGGTVDTVTRLVAEGMTARLGRQTVVDNRPGGGGVVGALAVAQAAPDGHTLLLGGIAQNIANQFLMADLPYDPARDFTGIGLIGDTPNVVVVPPSLGIRSMAEFTDLARRRPGAINFGASGTGTTLFMAPTLYAKLAGVELTHVAYRAGAVAQADLLAGRIQVMFDNLASAIGHIRAGGLVALAVTGRERSALLPDVPTIAETGLPGFDIASWWGIFAPTATPAPIIARLEAALLQVTTDTVFQRRLVEMGIRPLGADAATLNAHVARERPRWREIIELTGARADS